MRKLFVLFAYFFLLASFVVADTFSTDVQLNLTNTSLFWVVESGSETFSIPGNYSRTISINRNVSLNCSAINYSVCELNNAAILNLSRSAQVIADAHKDSISYYTSYLNCFGDLKSCQTNASLNVELAEKYEDCVEKPCFSVQDIKEVNDKLDVCEKEKAVIDTNRKKAEDNNWLFLIIGLAGGFLIYHVIQLKRKEATTQLDKEYPARGL